MLCIAKLKRIHAAHELETEQGCVGGARVKASDVETSVLVTSACSCESLCTWFKTKPEPLLALAKLHRVSSDILASPRALFALWQR